MFKENMILDTDSYKASHWPQYRNGTTGMWCYLTSRGGVNGQTCWFGLQMILEKYFAGPVITQDMVDEAALFSEAHGEPFNRQGWERIVKVFGGKLPLRIKAVPEGSVIPTQNILMSVESTDPETFWVASWFETQLVRLWYPVTVATRSWYAKRTILEALLESSDDPWGEIPFKLHDFGSRGVSSRESAGIGGAAHLVNFKGSDTIQGVRYANYYYNEPMSAFSIPAAEHSTITSWGRDGELDAYRNMVKQFGKPGKLVAVVSDSYNIFNAIEQFWCEDLLEDVQKSGATIVIRPDSGNPEEVVVKCLDILDRKLEMQRNKRGYKVLPPYFRLIQGDGVNPDSIARILRNMHLSRYSASNIAFGMGGQLLQNLNRDTQNFAYKCSEVTVNGQPVKVFKDPITDRMKQSKAGRLSLIEEKGHLKTIEGELPDDLLEPIFENGELLKKVTLSEIRARAEKALRKDLDQSNS